MKNKRFDERKSRVGVGKEWDDDGIGNGHGSPAHHSKCPNKAVLVVMVGPQPLLTTAPLTPHPFFLHLSPSISPLINITISPKLPFQ